MRHSLMSHAFPVLFVVTAVLLACLATGCGDNADTQSTTNTPQAFITVTVFSEQSQLALPNVRLAVTGPANAAVTPNAAGSFTVQVSQNGAYQITASAEGYTSTSRTVEITDLASCSCTQQYQSLTLALPTPLTFAVTPAGGRIAAGNGVTVDVAPNAVPQEATYALTVRSAGSLETQCTTCENDLTILDVGMIGVSQGMPPCVVHIPRALTHLDAAVLQAHPLQVRRYDAQTDTQIDSVNQVVYDAGTDTIVLTITDATRGAQSSRWHINVEDLRKGKCSKPTQKLIAMKDGPCNGDVFIYQNFPSTFTMQGVPESFIETIKDWWKQFDKNVGKPLEVRAGCLASQDEWPQLRVYELVRTCPIYYRGILIGEVEVSSGWEAECAYFPCTGAAGGN